MTAPIQEPTEGRTASGLGYGQRQLFRRPDPNAGPEEVPWIRRTLTSDESIASGTNDELIIWDSTENDYLDFFDDPSSTVTEVLVNGLYGIAAELVWDSSKTEGSVVSLNSNSSPGFNWNKGWYDEQNAGHTIEHTQTFYYERRLEANTELRLFVVHFAAVARSILGDGTLTETYMEVRYLAPWVGYAPGD